MDGRRGKPRRGYGRAAAAVLVFVLVLLAVGTWRLDLIGLGRDPLAAGQAAYGRGDWQGAADAARGRLARLPGDLESLRLLARASVQLGRDDAAQALFGRLGAERWAAEDYVLLGRVLARKNQPKLALDAWDVALLKTPDHPEALAHLIEVAVRKAQPERAAALAERLAAQPGWRARGTAALAAARTELGDPAAAAEALERTLTLAPAALEAEQRGVAVGQPLPLPAIPALRAQRARALLRLGQPVAAAVALGTAPPDDSETAWLQSRIALQKNDADTAAAWLERAGDYRGEHPWEPEPAVYLGEAACGSCHRSVHSMHRGTMHDRTFHRAGELAGLPRPVPLATPDPAEAGVRHTLDLAAMPPRFETEVADATFRAIVDYALGSGDRGLTFVGRDVEEGATGRSPALRELRLSRYADAATPGHWDVTTGHQPRPSASDGWLGRALSPDQARACLDCHTTDPRAIVTGQGAQAADRAIGCERCHGPGGNHVAAVNARLLDLAIAGESGLSTPAAINRQCGRCHSPVGDAPVSPSDPASIRFQATTLTWSRCYTDSGEQLGCLTCHNPHRNASKRVSTYEEKCLVCHRANPPGATAAPARTVCPVNPANGCTGCHMPLTRTAEIPHSPFTDHFIRIHREQPSRR